MKIYNGAGMLLGRLASLAAKDALLGEEIAVINCEKIILSGKKEVVFARETQRHNRGGYPPKSQKLYRTPNRWVRRTIRGMLPWKQARGKEAFKRIRCYNAIPEQFQEQQYIIPKGASAQKLPTLNYITIGEVCTLLGRQP